MRLSQELIYIGKNVSGPVSEQGVPVVAQFGVAIRAVTQQSSTVFRM